MSNLIKEISQLTVDIAKDYIHSHKRDIVEAVLFVGKYMTISYLEKEERDKINEVSVPEYCPLCAIREMPKIPDPAICVDCVLSSKDTNYCNARYTNVKESVKENYMSTAFAIKIIAEALLEKARKSD